MRAAEGVSTTDRMTPVRITSEDRASQLAWCLSPFLDSSPYWTSPRRRHRVAPSVVRPFRLPMLHRFGPHLAASTTTNQRRTLYPIMGSKAEPLKPKVIRRWAMSVVERDRASFRVTKWGEKFLDGQGNRAAIPIWRNAVAHCAFLLDMFTDVEWSTYSSLVVSTQHDPAIRALILSAHAARIPVVYISHAPVGNNSLYSDLPVNYAALRGVREVDYYSTRFGVPATMLDVVGNPASDLTSQPLPELHRGSPGLLALSGHPLREVQRVFELIRSAGVTNLIVAPHPRMNPDELRRILPDGWMLHEGGRTSDLLRAGPRYVIQPSSGVAWEASVLGLRTATLRFDERPISYPFLSESSVIPELRSPSDVRSFTEHDLPITAERESLRAEALAWCQLDGRASIDASRDLLNAVASMPSHARSDVLLDGWAEDGPAWAMSSLTETQD